MNGKRGTHVGVVISFALFITFLAFLYTILEPSLRTESEKKFLSDYIKAELIKQFSENLTTMSVKIDEGANFEGEDCIILLSIKNEINIEEMNKLVVKNEEGSNLKILESNEDLRLENNDKRNIKLYNSTWINPSPGIDPGKQCANVAQDQYSLGLTRKQEYVSKKKIESLVVNPITIDDLPSGVNFGFNFSYTGGSITTTDGNITKSVFADEVPVQYFDEDANIKQGVLTVRIW